jgi:hypothetical protein
MAFLEFSDFVEDLPVFTGDFSFVDIYVSDGDSNRLSGLNFGEFILNEPNYSVVDFGVNSDNRFFIDAFGCEMRFIDYLWLHNSISSSSIEMGEGAFSFLVSDGFGNVGFEYTGLALSFNNPSGLFTFADGLPFSDAGLSQGDIWCDTGADNVIKMVI